MDERFARRRFARFPTAYQRCRCDALSSVALADVDAEAERVTTSAVLQPRQASLTE